MAAHWLELRVRIWPRMWTCFPYCMLQSGRSATGWSHVQRTLPRVVSYWVSWGATIIVYSYECADFTLPTLMLKRSEKKSN